MFYLARQNIIALGILFSGVKDANAGAASVAESFKHPLTILLMQILVVLGVAKIVGYLFTRIGQQSVIGETVAGIMLGPLIGWIAVSGRLPLFIPPFLLFQPCN